MKEGKCPPHPYTPSHTIHLHTHSHSTHTHMHSHAHTHSTHTLTVNSHTHSCALTVSHIHSHTLPHTCTHTVPKVFHWPQRSLPSRHVWEWAPSARCSALRMGKGSSLVWDKTKMEPHTTWVAAQPDRAEWRASRLQPGSTPLLSLLPAQCQLPAQGAPLKLPSGFRSHEAPDTSGWGQKGRGTGKGAEAPPSHHTLPGMPSHVSREQDTTAP